MENKIFEESDLLKFYRSWNPEIHMNQDYEDPAYTHLQNLMTHSVPENNLPEVEVFGGYDDLCVFGYCKDGITLYCDAPIFDEEEHLYMEDPASPTSVVITKPGAKVLCSEMSIGSPMTFESLKALLKDEEGYVGHMKNGKNAELIDCRLKDFDLVLNTENGILTRAQLYPFRL